jgi:RNA recognition motif-containing protein
MVKLFVGGFPLEMDELELVKLIAIHGDVVTIKIVRDKKTKICKGYAFVEMKDKQNAEQVKEALNETILDGRALTINIVEEKPAAVAQPSYVKVRPDKGTMRPKRPRRQ